MVIETIESCFLACVISVNAASDAIANAQKFNADLTNATLYVTKPLDSECAKKVVQAGIKCVKYLAEEDEAIKSEVEEMFYRAETPYM